MNYAKMIKQLRNKLFMTQEEFGALFGVKGKTVNRWENDRFEPNLKVKKKLKVLFDENGIKDDGEV